jgi:hypothetical protein
MRVPASRLQVDGPMRCLICAKNGLDPQISVISTNDAIRVHLRDLLEMLLDRVACLGLGEGWPRCQVGPDPLTLETSVGG